MVGTRVGVVVGTGVGESEGGDVLFTYCGLSVRMQAIHGTREVILLALLVVYVEVELRQSCSAMHFQNAVYCKLFLIS